MATTSGNGGGGVGYSLDTKTNQTTGLTSDFTQSFGGISHPAGINYVGLAVIAAVAVAAILAVARK